MKQIEIQKPQENKYQIGLHRTWLGNNNIRSDTLKSISEEINNKENCNIRQFLCMDRPLNKNEIGQLKQEIGDNWGEKLKIYQFKEVFLDKINNANDNVRLLYHIAIEERNNENYAFASNLIKELIAYFGGFDDDNFTIVSDAGCSFWENWIIQEKEIFEESFANDDNKKIATTRTPYRDRDCSPPSLLPCVFMVKKSGYTYCNIDSVVKHYCCIDIKEDLTENNSEGYENYVNNMDISNLTFEEKKLRISDFIKNRDELRKIESSHSKKFAIVERRPELFGRRCDNDIFSDLYGDRIYAGHTNYVQDFDDPEEFYREIIEKDGKISKIYVGNMSSYSWVNFNSQGTWRKNNKANNDAPLTKFQKEIIDILECEESMKEISKLDNLELNNLKINNLDSYKAEYFNKPKSPSNICNTPSCRTIEKSNPRDFKRE